MPVTPNPGAASVPDLSQYLAPGEAARALGVSTTTLREWTHRGLLPSVPTPLGNLYRPNDVAAFVKAHGSRDRA